MKRDAIKIRRVPVGEYEPLNLDDPPMLKIQQRAQDNFRKKLERLSSPGFVAGDTPIEQLFWIGLTTQIIASTYLSDMVTVAATPEGKRATKDYFDEVIWSDRIVICELQVFVSDWRVDFLLTVRNSSKQYRSLIVECDGHDFHERTKEQAKKDRSRDRAVQQMGMPIYRFTGSEIWADPCACADQVIEWLETAAME